MKTFSTAFVASLGAVASLITIVACGGPEPAAAPPALPRPPPAPTASAVASMDAGAASVDAAPVEPPEAPPVTTFALISNGAAPRVARRYAFVAGKVDKRVVAVRQEVVSDGHGAPGQSFIVTVELKPLTVSPTSTHFELKLLKVDVPDVPPAELAQVQAKLAAFTGVVGELDVSAQGKVGDVDFKGDPRMKEGGGADVIAPTLEQAVETAFTPLPDEPVGVGAKWEMKSTRQESGVESTVKRTFTLSALSADGAGATVASDVELNVPRHALADRRAPPGTLEEMSGKGSQSTVLKFDHSASKVTGQMVVSHRIVLDGKTRVDTITLKNTLDTAK